MWETSEEFIHLSVLQVNDSMQKVLAKEKVSQSKSLDLQSQLSRAKAELCQLQKGKEDVRLSSLKTFIVR